MTKQLDVNLINGIALAFEGDAVYSLYIRRHLIFQGQTKPNQLHRLATRYVSAKAQASLIEKMLEQELLTEKELLEKFKELEKSFLESKNQNKSLQEQINNKPIQTIQNNHFEYVYGTK